MLKQKLRSTLCIRSLELQVNLGWRNKERQQEQAVFLDMRIEFQLPPKACVSDKLNDTICYAELIQDIRNKIAVKNYRLIEHLSAEIYRITKAQLPNESTLKVRITKFPKIDGLQEGVCFDYGDEK